MKKFLLPFLFAAFATAAVAQRQAKDSLAVRETLGRFAGDFSCGDFSDMKEYLTPDANWINIVGMHWHNADEVQFAHQAYAKTILKTTIGKNRELNTSIRFLTPDVAAAYVLTRIEDPNYPPGRPSKEGYTDDIATFILVKKNGRWLIASGQNNIVVAAAAPNDPVLHRK